MKKIVQTLTLILLIFLFIYTGITFIHKEQPLQVGDQATPFELETLSGEKLSIADYQGQPVVLNFFTTWCGPCIDELPELEKYNDLYSDDAPLLIIDRREPKNRVASFASEHQSSLLFLLDYQDDISKTFGVQGQPETIILDEKGVIRRYVVGGMTAEQIADEVKQIRGISIK